MFNWKHGLALAALLGASSFATIPSAEAATYYTASCSDTGSGAAGTELTCTFTASTGNLFIDSSIADLNLSGTVTGVTTSFTGGSGGGTDVTYSYDPTKPKQVDGQGNFTFTTVLNSNGGNPTAQTITIVIDGSNLALSPNGSGNDFAAHICAISVDTACANTFFTNNTAQETPILGALPLFGSVVGGAYLFARKRRRTYKTPVSAFA
jgi:hypothetical protein